MGSVTKTKFYTGVGSRKTPNVILKLMSEIATKLSGLDYMLRSGGAGGADSAFENGATLSRIFYANMATPNAMDIASKFHPAWERCSTYAKKLHGRNAFQVLGLDLNTPSSFLVCWTPDGACSDKDRSIRTGGTGTAISIADANNIPVFNLKCTNHHQRLLSFINNPKVHQTELF